MVNTSQGDRHRILHLSHVLCEWYDARLGADNVTLEPRIPMTTKTKALIALGILAIFDTVIPVPITALIVIFAIVQKPPWAVDLVRDIYGVR